MHASSNWPEKVPATEQTSGLLAGGRRDDRQDVAVPERARESLLGAGRYDESRVSCAVRAAVDVASASSRGRASGPMTALGD
ncbi:hypothetical protein V2G26_015170 [Clonostachys chloroleuca]